jgi:N-acetylmuramidase/Putative peptidoglycan binding domain
MANFKGSAEPLTIQGVADVLDDLALRGPELLAVVSVESKGCGYLPDKRPVILFERHYFHRLTSGRFSAEHPDISNATPGGYLGLEKEYARLEKAVALDRDAALRSASWGAGQVMGDNFKACGFADVDTMVAAMQTSEDAQLAAVGAFLQSKKLVPAMRAHDWATVARIYNGPSYAQNKYDLRLAGAYAQFAAGVLPDVDVRRAQLYLTYLGYAPGSIDGVYGKRSRDAVLAFRLDSGVGSGDGLDSALLSALQAKVATL